MNENDRDFMQQLTDLDENSVEEIAENYPVLDENQKRRILKKCLEKSGLPNGDIQFSENENISDEDSVSGIEHYKKPVWHKYASSVATLAVAVVGIASVAILRGNMSNDDEFDIANPPVVSEVAETGQVTKIVTGSYIDKGYNANGFDYAGQNDYSGIIIGGTTTAPPATEPSYVADNSSNQPDDTIEDSPVTPPLVTAPPQTSPPQTTTTTSFIPETTTTTLTEEIPSTVTTEITDIPESTTNPVPQPNKYGYYAFENPPATSISVASLIGLWYNTDNTQEILTVYEGEDLYDGSWKMEFQNGEVKTGYIRLEYSIDEYGLNSYWYNFYENNDELWYNFRATGEIPFDYLYIDKSETPDFLRNQKTEESYSDMVAN